ncbi:MAG: 4a-hydroxytetrahydrobiopterin dehydratase [Candidatus Limnocylindria bacterium]
MPYAALLTDAELADGLARLPDWHREDDTIQRTVKLGGFMAAIAFVNAVADAAEAANHHPDITIHGYSRVTLTLTTHAAKGLTWRDLDLAGQIDALVPG